MSSVVTPPSSRMVTRRGCENRVPRFEAARSSERDVRGLYRVETGLGASLVRACACRGARREEGGGSLPVPRGR